jgi:5-methylcytosine-specific restriction endonuclease McrA
MRTVLLVISQRRKSEMARKNFPKSVMVLVIKRATRDNVIYCEECGLPCKKFDIDHRIPDAMGGEPVLSNAQLKCKECHARKTKDDVAKIAKAKRVESAHLGVPTSKQKIQSRGFAKKPKKEKLEMPPRRNMFE